MIYAALLIGSYLLGSIPVGFLLARAAGKGDIRKIGSGGTGATNVMRIGGLWLAGAVWILDMAKAIAAVLLARHFVGADFGALCGAAAVFGHIFPVWLKFKGGKGISPMLGFVLAVNPLIFTVLAAEWLIVALGTGYSSLGSLVALILLPILGFAHSFNTGLACLAAAAMGLYGHRQNIARLIRGAEDKIKWKWKK